MAGVEDADAHSYLALLSLMQLAEFKGGLLVDVLTVELGLLAILFGRRFHAGWRSHTQQVLIGLSTAALADFAVQGTWQLIAQKTVLHSQADYERIVGLRDKLSNANSALYVAVLVWWIVCLWIDEPGAVAETPAEIPAETGEMEAAEEPDDASMEEEEGNDR